MWRALFSLIQDYGLIGLQISQFIVIVGCFYKMFTNHFKHLTEDFKRLESKVEGIDRDVKENTYAIKDCSNKISYLEGRGDR